MAVSSLTSAEQAGMDSNLLDMVHVHNRTKDDITTLTDNRFPIVMCHTCVLLWLEAELSLPHPFFLQRWRTWQWVEVVGSVR